MAFTTLRNGSKGDMVKALQYILGIDADGIYGPKTTAAVKAFQSKNGLTADGLAGKNTFAKIVVTAPTLRSGATGAYVYAVETLLTTMKLDGKYEEDEIAHVKTYQAAKNLTIDGIVGKQTYNALFGLNNSSLAVTEPTVVNTGTSVKPVDYKQYDSRWKSIKYTSTGSSSQTIGSSGCGPTSMADIIATWFNKNFTPKESCNIAKSAGYRTANSGTAWGFFPYMAKKYAFSKFVQTSSFATMQACLAAGGYVVVSFRPSKWTKGGHFCVLWKDDGKTIYVNDPASSSSARAKGTYSEVKAAAKQYFCFYPPVKK